MASYLNEKGGEANPEEAEIIQATGASLYSGGYSIVRSISVADSWPTGGEETVCHDPELQELFSMLSDNFCNKIFHTRYDSVS